RFSLCCRRSTCRREPLPDRRDCVYCGRSGLHHAPSVLRVMAPRAGSAYCRETPVSIEALTMSPDRYVCFIALLAAAACAIPAAAPPAPTESSRTAGATGPACDPDNGGLVLPPDFCALVVGSTLGPVRQLAVAPNG